MAFSLYLSDFFDSTQALIWRGLMVLNALLQLFRDSKWEDTDYIVVDMPPGTGDIHLTLLQNIFVDGAVIRSIPQEVALIDARKAISMFNQDKISIPVLGVIENMAYFTPYDMPDKKYYILGKKDVRSLQRITRLTC